MTTNPKDVKSQHELNDSNDGKRKSDVLLSTIEKCEQLEKENKKLKGNLRVAGALIQTYEEIAENQRALIKNSEDIIKMQDESVKMANRFFIIIFVCGCISALLEFWK